MAQDFLYLWSVPPSDDMPSDMAHLLATHRAMGEVQHEIILCWADANQQDRDSSLELQMRDRVLELGRDIREWAEKRYTAWLKGRA